MYTIFINDIPIILIDQPKKKDDDFMVNALEVSVPELLNMAISGQYKSLYYYHDDLKTLWKKFKKYFSLEIAAGGLIKNEKNETLFIFRMGKWDLPKGKIEKGESKKQAAIREVQEECGLEHVRILNKLQKTYHVFKRNGRDTLKITHWYLMYTQHEKNLVPQLEEDITEVVFKNELEIEQALDQTYGNIKLLLQKMNQ